MGRGCSLPNCPNARNYGKYIKGFGFPKSEELRKRWISIIQMNCPTWILTKYPRFCALHFDKNDIIDGKNNKLQYSAVPLYFNENIRNEGDRPHPTKTGANTKISTLLAEMQQNQLIYSSDSECEYQVSIKVTKKPRNSDKSANANITGVLRCDYCHKNKKNAVEMQSHLRTIHDVIVDIVTPKSASLQIKDEDLTKNFMCSICGLVFKGDPGMALDHVENSHNNNNVKVPVEEKEEENLQVVEVIDPDYVVQEMMDEDTITVEEIKNEEFDESEVSYIEVPEEKEIYVEKEPSTVMNVQTEDDLIEENVQTTYKCKLCSLDFMDRDEVKAHILESHTITKNEEESSDEEKEAYEPICYICKSPFNTLAKMRKHIKRIHKCEEYYFCQHCTGTFLSLDMYEDHECLEPMIV
uniref:CSON003036 protein n=1 Tax=Culicoides sonorensis TaxID=179676 RepID=A0A336LBM2_CULSO